MAKKQAAATKEAPDARLKIAVAAIQKQYGKDVLQNVEKVTDIQKFATQIPSGSIGLDLALGSYWRDETGRWHVGYAPERIIEIFGPEGSGKTTMALLLMANAQAQGRRCAFIDVEHAMDIHYGRALGVDWKRHWISQPQSAEQALDVAEKLLACREFGLIVIDSVAALIPQAELDGGMDEQQVGLQARLMGKAIRKLTGQLSNSGANLLFINQLRMKINVKYGSPETTPGGRALPYAASQRIDIRRIGQVKVTTDGEPVGHVIKAKVIKNKTAPPFKTAQFNLIWGAGLDVMGELVTQAVACGVMQVSGSWYVLDGKSLGQGKQGVAAALQADSALQYRIYNEVMTRHQRMLGFTPEGAMIPDGPAAHVPDPTQYFQPPIPG
jgi:recombination protein RecA